MGKLLVFVLGLCVVLGVGYYYFEGAGRAAKMSAESKEVSAPKQQLDNVREAAKRIEIQGQQQADRAARGSGE